MVRPLSLAAVALLAGPLLAQEPEWIWIREQARDGEACALWRAFSIPGAVRAATLTVTCDNHAVVWLNGREVARNDDWAQPVKADVAAAVREGPNWLAVRASNEGSVAGLCLRLRLELLSGARQDVISDGQWMAATPVPEGFGAAEVDPAGSIAVHSFGPASAPRGPWGDVFAERQATPAESLTLLPGFAAELLCSAQPGEGSWVCLSFDPEGRLVVSPQSGNLLRITLRDSGATVEPLGVDLGRVQGLAFAGETLFANVNDSAARGGGLWRIDAARLTRLIPLGPGGEHGPHAVLPAAGGKLWVLNGNHTDLPSGISKASPVAFHDEDLLLPRIWDPGGHAVDILAPGCVVLRTDYDGRERTLWAGGMRNAYDLDANDAGELFTFDSDMEWDIGLPWYRPTRIVHLVSGADYGWRSGTEKWPAYYADTLPGAVDIGLGSPTGVLFARGCAFPPRYRGALLACDWAYGRILAVHLTPDGASYKGTFETLVEGKPLNVTDLAAGPDGALYFVTGGRDTQSGLYRLRWVGPERPGLDAVARDSEATRAARALRHDLERWHGVADGRAVAAAWRELGSDDRFLRFAARVALEHQDPALWQERALTESEPGAACTALLALARVGANEQQGALLDRLGAIAPRDGDEAGLLAWLRVHQVCLARMGRTDAGAIERARQRLDARYPSRSAAANRELARLLAVLGAPGLVARTMALIDATEDVAERIHFALVLRIVGEGWTEELRTRYFEVVRAARGRQGGDSYAGYLTEIAHDALATVAGPERARFEKALGEPKRKRAERTEKEPGPQGRAWRLADLLPGLAGALAGRPAEPGKAVYAVAQCIGCHRFAGEGGGTGPDLTGVARRLSRRDLLEAILSPSKTISDQYRAEVVTRRDGEVVVGRPLGTRDGALWLRVGLVGDDERVAVPVAEILRREPCPTSPMPGGLLDSLTKEQVLDLLAYLEGG